MPSFSTPIGSLSGEAPNRPLPARPERDVRVVLGSQVVVAHQTFAGIVFIAVARVVHARPFIAAIPRIGITRISSSRIGHGSLRSLAAAVWVVP
jgi:hypothetical protein